MNEKSKHFWAAGCVALSASFLLCGYEFIRSASNTLFKQTYGKQNLPVIMALMPVGVILILGVYGRVLSWLGARRTLLATTLFSAAGIATLTLAVRAGYAPATGLLYVFREAYVVLLIEQYWSFLNSSLGQGEARKLNGLILGVASLGAILGGLLVEQMAQPLGTSAMPFFAAVALLPAALVSDLGYARAGEPQPSSEEARGGQGHLGLKPLLSSRLLIFLALVVVTTQVLSTALDLRFQNILEDEFPDRDRQTAFSGGFFALVNAVAAFLQFLVTPLTLSIVPLWIVLVGIPAIHLAACLALAISPSLVTAGAAYLLFKSFDYSIFRAAKEMLYIPLSFDARYRAKEVIDVFGYRFSKGGTSSVLALIQRLAGMTQAVMDSIFTLVAIGASAAWLLLVIPLVRHSVGRDRSAAP